MENQKISSGFKTLLNRMRIDRRLYIILIMAAATPIVLGAISYIRAGSDIGVVKAEMRGLEFIYHMRNVRLDLGEHQSHLIGYRVGYGSRESLDKAEAKVEEWFKKIDALDKNYGAEFETTKLWSEARAKWNTMQNALKNLSRGQTQGQDSGHVDLDTNLIEISRNIAEKSNLILDPEALSYYLIVALVSDFPVMIQTNRQLYNTSAQALMQRRISAADKDLIMHTTGGRKFIVRRIGQSIDAANRVDSKVKETLGQMLDKFGKARQEMGDTIQKNVVDNLQSGYTIEQLSVLVSRTTETFKLFGNDLDAFVRVVLEARLKSLTHARYFLVGSIAIALLFLFLLMYLVIRSIVGPLKENSGSLDASSRLMTEASQNLSSSSEQISQQSGNIAGASNQMTQNLQVVTSAAEEMSISIAEVATRASEAAKVSKEAAGIARNTQDAVKELGAGAANIGNVIEIISKIAEQTNMLALNASIEAAGAGEAGKGFAVVASEVKELARQTAASSENIKKQIQGIQQSTDRTVESIGQITDIIGRMDETNTTIASSVEEQAMTTKEIVSNVTQISTAASEINKNISGISSAVKDNAKDAQKLSEISAEMKTLSDALAKMC